MNIQVELSTDYKLTDYLRWHSYLSERHRLLYVSTPKVACTSLKWWFASLEGYGQVLREANETEESDLELSIHENFQKVAPHVVGLDPDGLSEALTSDAYFRFAVVRNPYKRIFSAWQSKLLLREPQQITPYARSEFLYHPIERLSDVRAAFEHFLEHLASNEAPSFWDLHWTPQAAVLRPDLIKYSKLAQLENVAELGEALEEWLKGSAPNPFGMRTNESLIPYLPDFISDRSAEFIRTLYAKDFAIFGYGTQIPSSAETLTAVQWDVAVKAIKLIRARHERLGARATQVRALKHSITDRDAEISGLGAAIAQRDEEAGGLKHAVADRDAEISSLGASIAQRDEEAGGLKRAIADRDAEISSLGGAIAQRAEEAGKLKRAIADRDAEISSLAAEVGGLKRAIADRDAERDDATRSLIETDEQVDTLQGELSRVLRSGFWRATAPFRAAVRLGGRAVGRKPRKYPRAPRDLVSKSALLQIRASKLFDADFYLGAYADVRGTGIDPARHYLTDGWKESRNPSPAFNTAAYLAANPDVAATGANPLVHYLRYGLKEGRPLAGEVAAVGDHDRVQGAVAAAANEPDPQRGLGYSSEPTQVDIEIADIKQSGLFDEAFYFSTYPDLRLEVDDPIRHYCEHGWRERRNPSPSFDTGFYLNTYDDVRSADINPFWHFVCCGAAESRKTRSDAANVNLAPTPAQIDAEVADIRKSGLFDEAFYLSVYRDVQSVTGDPIRHYCERGWREGRDPSPAFDTQHYLKIYSDIRNAGMNPFWHFVRSGAAESREAISDASPRYEDDIRFGAIGTDIKLLAFYAIPEWESLRRGRPRFIGHAQPILPNEQLGAYDPCDWRTLREQAQMAARHGVHGFCFDLNIAPGATTEAQPIGQLVAHRDIEIRFCVQLTISADCSVEVAAEALAPIFADRRQIRVDGRPVLLVKVRNDDQNASAFIAQLRQRFGDREVDAPFVIGRPAESVEPGATLTALCDAVLDLPADPTPDAFGGFPPVRKNGIDTIPYGVVAANGVARIAQGKDQNWSVYHGVMLAHDNTAANPLHPLVCTRFGVGEYRRWLEAAIDNTRTLHPEDRRFIFVDAWNDWGRGLQLEPDRTAGFSKLNETARALLNLEPGLRMPMVSIVVPNYNHELFLRRRLDSVYGQTYKNVEVILLDDCSSDASRSILDEYAANYSEITSAVYNDLNSGSPFGQWAKGIKAAKGELVWITESDDYCDEHFLEELVGCFSDESVLLAYGRSVFVDKEELPLSDSFESYVGDLGLKGKWEEPYIETAHREIASALGIKNTIPNVSSVVFRRPVDMRLLDDESWRSMRVAGDWIFYLHLLRGGKLAYRPAAVNFFRRYQGSTAERTYKSDTFYQEVGLASRAVAALYDVPWKTLERCRDSFEIIYFWHIPNGTSKEFERWYDYGAIVQARNTRTPNIMVTTMGFSPGGAEILPIRIANELKRQGHSVLLFSAGLNAWQDGVRRMVRNDVPVIESSDVEDVRTVISEFGVEALNTHQWHMQKYPLQVPDVYDRPFAHVASLHGMIEHGEAFEATEEQIRGADRKVTTWAYTADKNLGPFHTFGLCDLSSGRFVKIANGMHPPDISPVPRAQLHIPEDAFALCCVSRAIPDKGWAETIEAVDIARKLSGRDIRLILVGNGPVYDEYCKTGAPEFVHLVGFSENSVGHYAAADMGIMLTKFKSESFPLTIVDCLFAGKPYIASDIGEIRNILTVRDGIAGSVIPLDDWEIPVETAAQEIAAFATDNQKYTSASNRVGAAARRFRIDEVVSQYVRLFEAERIKPRLGERAI